MLFFKLSLVRNRQFGAALGSAGGQYAATVGGGHSFSEAVFVDALAGVGLISTFHGFYRIFKGCKGINSA